MKTPGISLMILSILSFGLSGCVNNTGMLQQITSLNVGCETKDVQVSNDSVELNGTQNWTAKCGGKTYYCNYLNESGSNCYELHEKKQE